jgi:hypothetical protein
MDFIIIFVAAAWRKFIYNSSGKIKPDLFGWTVSNSMSGMIREVR